MRPSRVLRLVMSAVAVAAVLIAGLVAGIQLNGRQQDVATASASPATTSGPSPTAAPSASGAILNDDFGFIVVGGDGPPHGQIRSESSSARVGSFGTQSFAVSPDGRQIAYWTLYAAGSELHVRPVAGGAEQSLATLTADQRAGGLAWSTDGAALLYSIDTGCGICGGPIGATLKIYELATSGRHNTTVDTQMNAGWYRPIAWDRSTNLAAAGLWVEGGSMVSYITFRIDTGNTFAAQRVVTNAGGGKLGILMQSVRASTDAKFALGVEFESGDITWWPLADFVAHKSQPGAGKRGAMWRPGTHQIGFMSGEQLWLGDVDRAGPEGLCCTAFSGAPATSALLTFRADGTAVVLGGSGVPCYSPSCQATYTLVRLGSDPKSTSGDRVTFQDLNGLIASVRLR